MFKKTFFTETHNVIYIFIIDIIDYLCKYKLHNLELLLESYSISYSAGVEHFSKRSL